MADEYVDQAYEQQYKFALDHHEDFVYEGHFIEDYSWNCPSCLLHFNVYTG
jgi:hypothetical protein